EILGATTDTRQYDDAGNTISSLLGSYTYDDQNRMVGFSKTGTTASYGYNGKGERVRKTVNSTITRFRFGPSGALLGEYDQMGQAIREYLYLEGQPVAQLQGVAPVQVAYLHTDHLGAVVKATDGAGSVVWDSDRKPFGERAVTVAQVEMPLGFPGQYYDPETGNYYNYFRDYDPGTGRYLQSDPIGLEGGINTYTYAINNPLYWIDPTGEAICGGICVGAAIGVAARAGIQYVTRRAGASIATGMATSPVWDDIDNDIPDSAVDDIPQKPDCPPDDEEDDDQCYENYLGDVAVCRAIGRFRGASRAQGCYASAADRLAACRNGDPIPPLNTWNN
ncbi:MAG: RHS repeat-associated core domain-containing protein, partial [Candidatus Thiodiazotropha taylori]